MAHPIEQYERNRSMYDNISEQVETTTEQFATVPRPKQEVLLNRAVTFALISTQTTVDLHERGYLNAIEATSGEELRQGLLDAGVNYYRNKAEYILHNLTEPDYDRILDLYDEYRDGDTSALHRMHRAIADECKGVGLRKSGFAMALCVSTEKMCIDTHVAQQAGLDANDVYNGVVVDRYEQQCDEILSEWPSLTDAVSRFMSQWIIFDANREQVTTHDAWFMSLPETDTVK